MYRLVISCLIAAACLPFQLAFAAEPLRVIYTYERADFREILADFGEQQGVPVSVEFQQQGELKSAIMTSLKLQTVPDAIIMPADHVGMHSFVGYSPLKPSMFAADVAERIWATSLSDGEFYGAPIIQGSHLVLYYNKALIEAPAQTWQALLEQDAALQKKGLRAISWSYDEPFWFLPFLGAYGGWPIENDVLNLNTEAMASALDFYKSLRDKALPYPSCSYQCTVDVFKAGKVAYTINGDWEGKNFHNALGSNLGVAAIPHVGERAPVSSFSTYVVAFPQNRLHSPKRELLVKLVNYLQSPAIQQKLWQETGSIPVERTAFEQAAASAQGHSKMLLTLMKDARPLPADAAMSFAWDAIGKGYIRHREGFISGKAAAAYMQKVAERHMRSLDAAPKAP